MNLNLEQIEFHFSFPTVPISPSVKLYKILPSYKKMQLNSYIIGRCYLPLANQAKLRR